ncbi:MAG: VOC family protein [Gemmatimonas sp.]|nr:VOC family protein [Gemmatimonas sp.]
MAVQPIPEGFHTVTPYLICKGADQVIDFMKAAFSAEVKSRMDNDDGTVTHADLQVGDSRVMISEAGGRYEPMQCMLHLYVEDCDAVYRKALDAGATSVQEVADQFYGDRSGGVQDVAGNQWWISTHVEDVDPEETARRGEEYKASSSS